MEKGLNRLIGLTDLKAIARRDIAASRVLNEPLSHVGLFGVAGCGKTFLAQCVAEELGYHFFSIEGSTTNSKNELTQLLVRADQEARTRSKQLLFFIDECHRLGKLQEVLYYPMVEWYIITRDGKHKLTPFALFAATTHPNMLLSSFMTRLSNTWYLHPYTVLQIQRIIDQQFTKWSMPIASWVSHLIAKRCLGIPRLANNLALKIRNEVIHRSITDGNRQVLVEDCERTFLIEDIDPIGLRRNHRNYLQTLYDAGGVPKGIGSIAGKIGLDPDVVEGSIEPTLFALHLVDTTARGRILTRKGREHLEFSKKS